jgi:hypothetical protein
MTRRHVRLPAALILVALIPVAVAAELMAGLRANLYAERVSSVAGLLDAASRNPKSWDGTVVRVRGVVQPGLVLLGGDSRLLSAAPATPVPDYVPLADTLSTLTVLWVTGRRDTGLLALLHRLPVVGAVVPGPRPVRLNAMTTYRVQLQANPAQCPSPTCVVGTLLDYTTPGP